MTTPLAPENGLFTRIYLGETDVKAEEAYKIGVTRSVGVAEGRSFNTAGMFRAPTSKDGSVRLATYVADEASIFSMPGANHGLIATSTATTSGVLLANVPVSAVSSDIVIGEYRRYEIDNSPTNGLPVWGGMDYDKIGAAISSGEDTAEVELGAAAVGQQLMLRVVLIGFTGTNIMFQVEHDTTGFASPTDAFSADLTFTGTGQNGLVTTVDTAISDTFWRFSTTGTFSSAEFLAGFGIT